MGLGFRPFLDVEVKGREWEARFASSGSARISVRGWFRISGVFGSLRC